DVVVARAGRWHRRGRGRPVRDARARVGRHPHDRHVHRAVAADRPRPRPDHHLGDPVDLAPRPPGPAVAKRDAPGAARARLRVVAVGAARRLGAVRGGVAGRVVWAWVLTIPGAAAVAAVTSLLIKAVA